MTPPTIQQQLQSSKVVRVTPGDYVTTNGPITIGQDQTLDLTGSTVRGSGPLVVLSGDHSTLIGGKLIANAGTTAPIIGVKGAFRFKIDSTQIVGDVDQLAIGIQVDSPDPANNDIAYYGTIRDVEIKNVAVGIVLTEQANGIHIANPLISAAKTSYFRLVNAYGNQVIGGFSNGGGHSGQGAITFDLQSPPSAPNVRSQMNVFLGHVTETGNAGRPYVISQGSDGNKFLCQFNVSGTPQDHGKNNVFFK